MKKLTIMRHGKAEPRNQPNVEDKDRQLEDRGRKDARRVGEFYSGMVPDLIVASEAVRAVETARFFAEGAGYSEDVKVDDRIYHNSASATVDEIVAVIRDQEGDHLMIVGHNNGVSDLVPHLDGGEKTIVVDPLLVTAATAHIVFEDLDKWADLQPDTGQLRALLSPRFIKDLSG